MLFKVILLLQGDICDITRYKYSEALGGQDPEHAVFKQCVLLPYYPNGHHHYQ